MCVVSVLVATPLCRSVKGGGQVVFPPWAPDNHAPSTINGAPKKKIAQNPPQRPDSEARTGVRGLSEGLRAWQRVGDLPWRYDVRGRTPPAPPL